MSAFDESGVHEPQQPQRSRALAEGLKRGFAGAALGAVAGAVSSGVTFLISVFVGAQFDPNFWWALVGTAFILFVGAGVGAIFGAAFLAATKLSFEWAGAAGCLGGVLTGTFPLWGAIL
jgi:hypothetical protein